MAYPKIVYNSTTLNFTYPPRHVPAYDAAAVRHDNIASSGVLEVISERTDLLMEFDVEVIPSADVSGWKAFLDWAVKGQTFDYYPDASLSAFTTYTLENTAANIARRTPGTWQLTGLKLREVVSA